MPPDAACCATPDAPQQVVVPCNAVAFAGVRPCFSSLFLDAVPPSQRGVALGGLDVLSSGIGVAAPLLGGWLFASWGLRLPFAVAGTAYLATAVAVGLLLSPAKPKSD